MKVKELIRRLKRLDPDAEVVVQTHDQGEDEVDSNVTAVVESDSEVLRERTDIGVVFQRFGRGRRAKAVHAQSINLYARCVRPLGNHLVNSVTRNGAAGGAGPGSCEIAGRCQARVKCRAPDTHECGQPRPGAAAICIFDSLKGRVFQGAVAFF